ncbi:putative membrane transporter protein [Hyella patelloides LEGE 07179]|uniref:Probable membrane transporter protein n=1 Tax=Hyella patelloides LEGE 07179 TaxID=945734 RepID=A0A563VR81_9CYAN|nr:sulfite exporter TauE/SafE family protein [Hyella patelloides]VEP13914.1 putative membrane transporter protein [Hyella patelloides LEGE 07179]
MLHFWGLLPLGIVVGLIAAILGIGGGLLYVPALTLVGASPIQATATSLLGISLGAISSSFQNWRSKYLNTKLVILLAIPAMLSVGIGVAIANRITENYLLFGFAGLQLVAIYLVNWRKNLARAQQTEATKSVSLPKVASIGFSAGILSGLFGVGGGIIMVPLQRAFLGESLKASITTSLGAIVLISGVGVTQHALAGNVLWLPGLLLGVGSLIGGQLGARLLPKLPETWVQYLFTGLLISLAIYMIQTALS